MTFVLGSKTYSFVLVVFFLGFLLAPACSLIENKRMNQLGELLTKGNTALQDGQYDEAIEFYNRGLEMAPEEVLFLSNKAMALRLRGSGTYNKAIKLSDANAKANGMILGKRDLEEAASLSARAVENFRGSLSIEIYNLLSGPEIKLAVTANHAETLRVVATLDKSRTDDAVAAIDEYIKLETDSARKTAFRLVKNKLYLESGNGVRALEGYREILNQDPEQLDAILGVGLALSQSGDDQKFKEAKFFLKRFVEKAPDEHPMKADVKQTLAYMK